jgi:hypothetical protein
MASRDGAARGELRGGEPGSAYCRRRCRAVRETRGVLSRALSAMMADNGG